MANGSNGFIQNLKNRRRSSFFHTNVFNRTNPNIWLWRFNRWHTVHATAYDECDVL